MYKHGVRGPWGALGKYNAVGNAVGGIVDITGDFNAYSGKDLGIAVGIDSAKAYDFCTRWRICSCSRGYAGTFN